jgi:nitrite reductase/ring-hydroxylating ferredoxin subunit
MLTNPTAPRFHDDLPPEVEVNPDHNLIRCPWHAWEFDLGTGEAVFGAGVHVATYKAYVSEHPELDAEIPSPDGLQVPPPVETYRATIEAGYVVVEVRT